MGADEDEGQLPLEGAALAPYKSPSTGLCWWCGARADTREHKFKRTDLTRMWGDSDHLVWGGVIDRLVKVRSARKSPTVKFEANLCAQCNNARSQLFDYAYDKYAEYVWSNLNDLWGRQFIDMSTIYGSSWSTDVLNLARYFAKHIGCRMANDGYSVPPSIVAFLDGASKITDVHMVLFKDPQRWNLRREGLKNGIDADGLWIAPAMGAVSTSRQRLTMYSSASILAYIGVMHRWDEDARDVDPFYIHKKARLHRRDQLPDL
ncbi:hypothetical protein ABZ914_07045 [Spirillospora sp. NPDC046719]